MNSFSLSVLRLKCHFHNPGTSSYYKFKHFLLHIYDILKHRYNYIEVKLLRQEPFFKILKIAWEIAAVKIPAIKASGIPKATMIPRMKS